MISRKHEVELQHYDSLAALLAAMMAAPAAVKPPRLAVIGRGCDPVRARFAEKQWAPRLGVDMDSATSDEELFGKLAKRRFDLFFMVRRVCPKQALSALRCVAQR